MSFLNLIITIAFIVAGVGFLLLMLDEFINWWTSDE